MACCEDITVSEGKTVFPITRGYLQNHQLLAKNHTFPFILRPKKHDAPVLSYWRREG